MESHYMSVYVDEVIHCFDIDIKKDQFPDRFPKRLKTLAFNVEFPEGNLLLHQFVLGNSHPNRSGAKSHIRAVLLSMPDNGTVNVRNSNGYSALHLAVLKKNVFMVEMLLTSLPNIDINARCKTHDDATALHLAARLGDLSMLKVLLDNGADVNVINKNNMTALYFAVQSRLLTCMEYLIDRGARVDLVDGFCTPLHSCALSGYLSAVELLVDKGANVNAKSIGMTVLHWAIISGSVKVVKFLIDNKADVNAYSEGMAPLQHAAKAKNIAIMELLLENGACMTNQGHHLLCYCIKLGSLNLVEFLIERGADVNCKEEGNDTPLHYAVKSGNLSMVMCLISKGADMNAENDNGYTPLISAMVSYHVDIIKYLLCAGVNVNAKNQKGDTPLIKAVLGDKEPHSLQYRSCRNTNVPWSEVATLLLAKGADVNGRNRRKQTALHLAVKFEDYSFVLLLLNRNADINARDESGSTPLHYARKVEIIELLLKRGADVEIRDFDGHTPLLCRAEQHLTDCGKLLLGSGANANV